MKATVASPESRAPVQMGNDDLYTLLNVLRPNLVIDQSSFAHCSQAFTRFEERAGEIGNP
jgi:hypothetical protein